MAYTPQCLQALMWFAEREPVGWFDRTTPSHTMRSALEQRGLIKRIESQRAWPRLIKYELTPLGHEVMKGTQR